MNLNGDIHWALLIFMRAQETEESQKNSKKLRIAEYKEERKIKRRKSKKMENKLKKVTKSYDLRYRGYPIFSGTQMDCVNYLMEQEDKNVCICFSSGGYSLYPLDYVEAEPLTRKDKQNSIERFAVELWENMSVSGDGEVFTNLLEKAKAKHKEEIINAHYYGSVIVMSKPNDDMLQLADEYYNETFNTNEK